MGRPSNTKRLCRPVSCKIRPGCFSYSEMLSTDTFHMVITDRIPEQKYFYQVIAREDKGWKGVDYNKSPETLFTTSRRKGNLKTNLLPPKPAQIYTTPPTVQELTEGMEYETEAPVSSLKNEESSLVNEYLVWIVVGSLAVILIIVGLVYNIRRRNTRKDIDLDSQIGRKDEWADDDLSDFDDDDDDQRGRGGGKGITKLEKQRMNNVNLELQKCEFFCH